MIILEEQELYFEDEDHIEEWLRANDTSFSDYVEAEVLLYNQGYSVEDFEEVDSNDIRLKNYKYAEVRNNG